MLRDPEERHDDDDRHRLMATLMPIRQVLRAADMQARTMVDARFIFIE